MQNTTKHIADKMHEHEVANRLKMRFLVLGLVGLLALGGILGALLGGCATFTTGDPALDRAQVESSILIAEALFRMFIDAQAANAVLEAAEFERQLAARLAYIEALYDILERLAPKSKVLKSEPVAVEKDCAIRSIRQKAGRISLGVDGTAPGRVDLLESEPDDRVEYYKLDLVTTSPAPEGDQ